MSETRTEIATHEAGGEVATVTYDNEAKLNCMDEAAAHGLAEAISRAGTGPDLRVIVLRGAGDRALIGGADIRYMRDLTEEQATRFITSLHLVCEAIRRAPVPVIARAAGYCLGAGLEIAAACDIRIADEAAVLGMPEVQVGLPSVIEAALLPRLVGWGRSNYLVYTGQTIDAATALAWGLVEQVVPTAELDAALARVVGSICAAGPRAIRLQKELCRDWEELPLRDAVQRGIDIFPRGFASGEPQERLNAFLGRRK